MLRQGNRDRVRDRDREQDQEETKPPVKENAQAGRHVVQYQKLEDVRLLRSEIEIAHHEIKGTRLYPVSLQYIIISYIILKQIVNSRNRSQ
jgi:hypothetical protein